MLSIPIENTIWSYYESLAVTAVPTEKGWRVLIPIPIQLEGISSFQLFEGLSFPLMNPNTNTSIITELPSKYLALSADRTKHMALNPQDLQSCLHFENNYVCPKSVTIQKNINNCMWSAFNRNLQTMDSFCKRRILTGNPTPKHLYGGKWAYAFWNATKIDIYCSGLKNGTDILKGNGILNVPNGCWVTSDSFTLLGSLHGVKQVNFQWNKDGEGAQRPIIINQILNVSKWIDSLLNSSHAPLLKMNRAEIHDVLEADKDVDVSLDDLRQTWTISQAQGEKIPSIQGIAMNASQWSLSSLALLLVFILIMYKLCVKRSTGHSEQLASTVVMHTHAAGCPGNANDLVRLGQEVETQKLELQRLWQELSRMKKYQL